MSDIHTTNKAALQAMRAAMAEFEPGAVQAALKAVVAPDAVLHMPHPLGDFEGPEAFYAACYAPLIEAMPDLERRDWIVMAGRMRQGPIGWAAAGITWARSWRRGWIFRPPGIWRICGFTSFTGWKPGVWQRYRRYGTFPR